MAEGVRITKVPPGEAPLWVRRAWVGLELPLALRSRAAVSVGTHGVFSAPRGELARLLAAFTGRVDRQRGFVVDARIAVDLLEDIDPRAAAWWRKHAAHVLRRGRCFVFAEESGEVVTDAARR